MNKSILMRSCAFLAVPILGVAAVPTTAVAQQITTTISGKVADEAGAPVAGASVIVTDNRTGASRTIKTGNDGLFSADNLTTGGPYSITATADGFQGQTVEGVNTSLQGATTLGFNLAATAEGTAADTIVVTAARANIATTSTGPGSSFSAEVMETAPTFQRDVRDIIRLDPRVSLDRNEDSGQDRVSCLGGNDRGNAFTVDGIAQSDIYGLNETGFSARSSTPIPYDAVRETQVNFAPFDVEYGQFTGCAINVVTRSGSNTIHGGGFFEVTGDDFTGEKAGDLDFSGRPDYRDKRWGVSLSAPIIKDKLFVFGAYEHIKSATTNETGPLGGGFAKSLDGITVADFTRFSQIAKDIYGVETGPIPSTLPFTNKRIFGRVDYQINDANRFEATYQKISEASQFLDDYNTAASTAAVTGTDNTYLKGSEGRFISARLYSQLTDNLSTELRYANSRTIDVQDPAGGGEAQSSNPITRLIVGTYNPDTGKYGALIAGPGYSRGANDLRSWVDQYKAAAKLDLGAHKLKLGFEANSAHVYNLFVQNATGTLQFANLNDFEDGKLTNGTDTNQANGSVLTSGAANGAYGNFPAGGDINNAAADFRRTIYSTYLQDEWRVTDALDVTAGMRVDIFSGDRPSLNNNFFNRYKVRNDTGFGDVPAVFLPRISATYRIGDLAFMRSMKVRGGFGIFSGGDPLVWFGNAFQNDGATYSFQSKTTSNCGAGGLDVVNAADVYTGFPTCVSSAGEAAASAGTAKVQFIDPDIRMPTVNRFNLGVETTLNFGPSFLNSWRFNADLIHSRYKNPLTIVDIAQAVNPSLGLNGYMLDGRPIYRGLNLTAAGCNAKFQGFEPTPTYSDITAACFTGSARDDELGLTNADGYKGTILSFLLSKNFNRGIFTSGGNVFVNFGYAYQDVQDRRNMYNSTAGSNFDYLGAFDRQDPAAVRGFYSQKHNFTLSTSFKERFFGDNDTSFGMSFIARSGRPFSLVYTGGSDFNVNASGSFNTLIYVPTGADDPNITYTNDTVKSDYLAFLNSISCDDKYRGRTIERNSCTGDWYYDMDLRFAQEIPGPLNFFSGRRDKIELYAMVDNFLNLLDKNWNVFRRRDYRGTQGVADLASTPFNSAGQYIVGSVYPDDYEDDNEVRSASSLWRLKIGAKYSF